MRIYVGDLEPDLEVVISDPVDTVDATGVNVVLTGRIDGEQIFSRAPDQKVFTPAEGSTPGYTTLYMNWRDGDTDRPGVMKIEVKINWPGEPDPQTIVPLRTVRIRVP
jgi:hypothetical protein